MSERLCHVHVRHGQLHGQIGGPRHVEHQRRRQQLCRFHQAQRHAMQARLLRSHAMQRCDRPRRRILSGIRQAHEPADIGLFRRVDTHRAIGHIGALHRCHGRARPVPGQDKLGHAEHLAQRIQTLLGQRFDRHHDRPRPRVGHKAWQTKAQIGARPAQAFRDTGSKTFRYWRHGTHSQIIRGG